MINWKSILSVQRTPFFSNFVQVSLKRYKIDEAIKSALQGNDKAWKAATYTGPPSGVQARCDLRESRKDSEEFKV